MKPINSKERKTLYLQFLLLYMLSILVIIITMHFYYSIPEKELNLLREQKEEFNSVAAIPRKVMDKMIKIDSLLLIIGDPSKPMDQPVFEVNEALTEIKGYGDKNANSMDSLFTKIYRNYFEILSAKKESRSGINSASISKDLNEKYEELKEKFEKCDLENEKLKIQIQMK
jgi:hypothetical protein